jgi:hypothetical protein
MSKFSFIAAKSALASLFLCGVITAATVAGDLSKYRGFQFGADLPTVAKQTGAGVSQAKVIHSRPALIQELEWRPQTLGPNPQQESANALVFSFYNGELYRIVVNYDRYEIEGLTAEDIIEAVSTIYGPAARPAISAKAAGDRYSDPDEVVARWQEPQYSFDLMRSSYDLTFKLIGVVKRLDSQAQAAVLEAKRLDVQEAPQRDAARQASEQDAVRAKLEKSRLLNKLRFRP